MPLERCPECGGLGGHLGTCQRGATPESERPREGGEARPTSGGDLLIGGIFLAIGLVITFGTAAAAKAGTNNGGIYSWYGPLVYGTIPFGRGLSRALTNRARQ